MILLVTTIIVTPAATANEFTVLVGAVVSQAPTSTIMSDHFVERSLDQNVSYEAYGRPGRTAIGVVVAVDAGWSGPLFSLSESARWSRDALIMARTDLQSYDPAVASGPVVLIVNRTEIGSDAWRPALPETEQLDAAGHAVELRWTHEKDLFVFFVDPDVWGGVRREAWTLLEAEAAYEAFLKSLQDSTRFALDDLSASLTPNPPDTVVEDARAQLRSLREGLQESFALSADYPVDDTGVAPFLGALRQAISDRHDAATATAQLRFDTLDSDAAALDASFVHAQDAKAANLNVRIAVIAAVIATIAAVLPVFTPWIQKRWAAWTRRRAKA